MWNYKKNFKNPVNRNFIKISLIKFKNQLKLINSNLLITYKNKSTAKLKSQLTSQTNWFKKSPKHFNSTTKGPLIFHYFQLSSHSARFLLYFPLKVLLSLRTTGESRKKFIQHPRRIVVNVSVRTQTTTIDAVELGNFTSIMLSCVCWFIQRNLHTNTHAGLSWKSWRKSNDWEGRKKRW